MRSRDPAMTAPSGQPSPLERQSVTVSNSRPYSAAGVPLATAAFMSRAPSRCTESPCARASATTSWRCASGQTLPPPPLWVFSMQTSLVGAVCRSPGGLTASRTSSAVKIPCCVTSDFITSPECTAGPPSS